MRVKVEHHEKAMATDAWRIGPAAWAELMKAGLCDPHGLVLEYDLRASIATVNGKIAGFIFWKATAWNSVAFINLSYVLPAFRRRGVFSNLYRATRKEAKRLGSTTIQGSIDSRNAPMRRAAEKMGRKPVCIVYEAPL